MGTHLIVSSSNDWFIGQLAGCVNNNIGAKYHTQADCFTLKLSVILSIKKWPMDLAYKYYDV